ncbi:MAG: helix-hairpin-helix domain-containing protein, partial [Nitrososphaeraceae archaeon]
MAKERAKINTESDSYKDTAISNEDGSIIDAADLELKDIEGIGPTTAKKLKEAGIISVLELAVTSADQLSLDIGCSKDTAATYIMESQRLLRQ